MCSFYFASKYTPHGEEIRKAQRLVDCDFRDETGTASMFIRALTRPRFDYEFERRRGRIQQNTRRSDHSNLERICTTIFTCSPLACSTGYTTTSGGIPSRFEKSDDGESAHGTPGTRRSTTLQNSMHKVKNPTGDDVPGAAVGVDHDHGLGLHAMGRGPAAGRCRFAVVRTRHDSFPSNDLFLKA
ncbi:hypothetical protein LZ30DRAFT_402365 [Colletotrichum cereale]|nr:hypothetical protein LZ30DRAFT_402365 [Colletotrichum cereale]